MLKNYLNIQFSMHRAIEPSDLVKLCFQAAYGAEHILSDKDMAYKWLCSEFNDVELSDILYEEISDDIVRVNLGGWKAKGYNIDDLFNIFVSSVSVNTNKDEMFYEYLEDVKKFLLFSGYDDLYDLFIEYLNEYLKSGVRPVHHSENYRTYNKSSYRIVKKELLIKFLNSK